MREGFAVEGVALQVEFDEVAPAPPQEVRDQDRVVHLRPDEAEIET